VDFHAKYFPFGRPHQDEGDCRLLGAETLFNLGSPFVVPHIHSVLAITADNLIAVVLFCPALIPLVGDDKCSW
jgi:hypothetical protein